MHGNDLYYQRNPLAPAEQVTTSGQYNVVYNGVADWTYQRKCVFQHFRRGYTFVYYLFFHSNELQIYSDMNIYIGSPKMADIWHTYD